MPSERGSCKHIPTFAISPAPAYCTGQWLHPVALPGRIRFGTVKSLHEHQMTDEEGYEVTGLVCLLDGHHIGGVCLHKMACLL